MYIPEKVTVADNYNALTRSGEIDLITKPVGLDQTIDYIAVTKNYDAEANGISGVLLDEGGVKGLADKPDISLQQRNGLLTVALLDAGVPVLAAHSRSSELAMDTHTPDVTNSFNSDLSPAGSGGGAGSLVRSGLLLNGVKKDVVATGSDFGGSIRLPAAVHGLFGLKPSEGVVYGGSNDINGLSVHGVIASSPERTASVLDLLPRYSSAWGYSFSTGTELSRDNPIAWMPSLDPSNTDTNIHTDNQNAIGVAVERLNEQGYRVDQYDSPLIDHIDEIKETYAIIAAVASHSSLADWTEQGVRFDSKLGDISKQARTLADLGALYGDEYKEALLTRRGLTDIVDKWMDKKGIAAILTPTIVTNPQPTEADMRIATDLEVAVLDAAVRFVPKILKAARLLQYSARKNTPDAAFANYTGNPAATYNQLTTGVGVQLLTRKYTDNQLVSMADTLHVDPIH